MNRRPLLLARLVSLVALLCISHYAQAPDLAPKFDEYLQALVQQDRFTGTALVARDGKILFSKGYGTANAEWDIPNTTQTKFRLGSITKQFTAAAILLLQERGKLNVQDPICKYIGDCPKTWEPITIHHLLTHTSGIPSYTEVKTPDDFRKLSITPVTVTGFVDSFKPRPLEFTSGEKYKYNNSGYFALGLIIEKITGQSYEAFLQENIFTPLKLTHTGYDTHGRILKGRATGYTKRDGVKANSDYIDMTVPYAAGSLYSTVEDLFAWNEALFADKLLTAKSRELMMTVFKDKYAYGVGVDTRLNRQIISHGGGINGFSTYLLRFPAERVTVAVLRNADYGTPGPGKIAQDLAAILFGEKYEIPPAQVAVKVDPKLYDYYAGQYELGPNSLLTISKDGDRLMAQAAGQPKLELLPSSETKFFVKEIDLQMTFVKDAQGQITHLVLHQGGDRPAKKIK